MRNNHDPKRENLAPQSLIDQLSYDPVTGIISSETLRFNVRPNTSGHKMIGFGRAKYSYARLIFQILGINITGLVIHHINHDESDNRFVNLQPMSNSAHSKLHNVIRAHVRDFDSDYWTMAKHRSRAKQFSLPLFVINNEQVFFAAAGLSRPAAAQAATPRKLKTTNLKKSNSLPGYRPASVASE